MQSPRLRIRVPEARGGRLGRNGRGTAAAQDSLSKVWGKGKSLGESWVKAQSSLCSRTANFRGRRIMRILPNPLSISEPQKYEVKVGVWVFEPLIS